MKSDASAELKNVKKLDDKNKWSKIKNTNIKKTGNDVKNKDNPAVVKNK